MDREKENTTSYPEIVEEREPVEYVTAYYEISRDIPCVVRTWEIIPGTMCWRPKNQHINKDFCFDATEKYEHVSYAQPNPAQRAIAVLNAMHPNIEHFLTHGGCFQLYLLLEQQFGATKEIIPFNHNGHIYSKIGAYFYDIKGMHNRLPEPAYDLREEPRIYEDAFTWHYYPETPKERNAS